MKIRWNHRYVQLGVTAFLVIAASILFYYGIFHMKSLITGIKTFFGIMAPIIYGAAIAYLLTPIVNFLERKIIFPIFEKRNKALQKKGRKVVRWICVILSVFLMFLVIYALVMMILPQLIRSIMNIIYWRIKRDLLPRQKWLFMQFFQPNGQPFLFIPCVLRIKPLVDLSAERSWIPQLSVYCVMLEHRSSEPHMRFWSV